MSTTAFTFETIASADVTDTMLKDSADLFSSAYGVWGPLAKEKMGNWCKPGK